MCGRLAWWMLSGALALAAAACVEDGSRGALVDVPEPEFSVDDPISPLGLEETFAWIVPSATWDPQAGWVVIDAPSSGPSIVFLSSGDADRWDVHGVEFEGLDLVGTAHVSDGRFVAVNHRWVDDEDVFEIDPGAESVPPYRDAVLGLAMGGIEYSPLTELVVTSDFRTWSTSPFPTLPWPSPWPITLKLDVRGDHIGLLVLLSGVERTGAVLLGGRIDSVEVIRALDDADDGALDFALTDDGFVIADAQNDSLEFASLDDLDSWTTIGVDGLLAIHAVGSGLVSVSRASEGSIVIDRWSSDLDPDSRTRTAVLEDPLSPGQAGIVSSGTPDGLAVGFTIDESLSRLWFSTDGGEWSDLPVPEGVELEGAGPPGVLVRDADDRWYVIPG